MKYLPSHSSLHIFSIPFLLALAATVDVSRVRAEEERVFRSRNAQFSQLGVGVTLAAQSIFDSLAKTYPCKWDRDIIVILDSVRLSPPYDVKSITYVIPLDSIQFPDNIELLLSSH